MGSVFVHLAAETVIDLGHGGALWLKLEGRSRSWLDALFSFLFFPQKDLMPGGCKSISPAEHFVVSKCFWQTAEQTI